MLRVIVLCVNMPIGVLLCDIIWTFIKLCDVLPDDFRQNVVILSVVMLNVVASISKQKLHPKNGLLFLQVFIYFTFETNKPGEHSIKLSRTSYDHSFKRHVLSCYRYYLVELLNFGLYRIRSIKSSWMHFSIEVNSPNSFLAK